MNEQILKAATPRPWEATRSNTLRASHVDIADFWDSRVGVPAATANTELAAIAVNSYEAREALIADLVTALENSRSVLVIEGYQTGDNDNYHIMEEIDAALAAAKKVQP